jgi:hypothetical protein
VSAVHYNMHSHCPELRLSSPNSVTYGLIRTRPWRVSDESFFADCRSGDLFIAEVTRRQRNDCYMIIIPSLSRWTASDNIRTAACPTENLFAEMLLTIGIFMS